MVLFAFALAVAGPVENRRATPPVLQHLVPEEAADSPRTDPLAKYRATVHSVLKEAFAPEVAARAIVYPSFSVEYAVGLRRGPGGWEIFALHPTTHSVWTYTALELMRQGRMGSMTMDGRDRTGEEMAELRKGLPANPADLPLSRCSVPLGADAADAVAAAWRTMLEEVKADPAGEPGLDGTDFHFSMESGGRTLAGRTWSPRSRSRPAKLTALAAAMQEICERHDATGSGRILALAREVAPAASRTAPRP
jgi:hypothetical protein